MGAIIVLEHREPLEVVLDGLVDARVLDLDGDPLSPARHGAVNLPDAGGRERIALPLREDLTRVSAEVLTDDLDRAPPATAGGFLLKARRDPLELVLVSGRGEAVDVRRHLTELQWKPFHLAQCLEHGLGGLLGALQDATARFELLLLRAACAHGAPHGLGRDRQGRRAARGLRGARGGRDARRAARSDAEPAAVQRCGGRAEATTTS